MATLTYKTRDQIRTDILRTLSNGYKARGVANPNVGYGSDDYVWAQAAALEIEPVYANTVAAADAQMPDTAGGADLARQMGFVGLAPKGAGPSRGTIQPLPSSATAVPTGAILLDPTGNVFTVEAGGPASATAPGTLFTVTSQNVGSATNLPAGTVLRWQSPPPYMPPTVTLAGAATGGVDAENDDAARARLLAYYAASQGGGGNASQVAIWAEQSSPEILAAFVYPAANGPGTEHVAVMGYWTATYYSPTVSAASLALAISAVQGNLPEYVESVITTVAAAATDVAIRVTLPNALTAIPAGTGGGWIDASPFPVVANDSNTATNQRCRVLSVTSTTSISVESMRMGAIGATVAWVDKSSFKLVTSKILTITETLAPSGSTMGQYAITLDTPLVGAGTGAVGQVQVNDFVFPAAVETQKYINAILATYAKTGPGEKTSATGLLPRAYRQPRPTVSWPYALDSRFLQALTASGPEVQSAAWAWQNGTPAAVAPTPALPAAISGAPNVFTPARLALYPA